MPLSYPFLQSYRACTFKFLRCLAAKENVQLQGDDQDIKRQIEILNRLFSWLAPLCCSAPNSNVSIPSSASLTTLSKVTPSHPLLSITPFCFITLRLLSPWLKFILCIHQGPDWTRRVQNGSLEKFNKGLFIKGVEFWERRVPCCRVLMLVSAGSQHQQVDGAVISAQRGKVDREGCLAGRSWGLRSGDTICLWQPHKGGNWGINIPSFLPQLGFSCRFSHWSNLPEVEDRGAHLTPSVLVHCPPLSSKIEARLCQGCVDWLSTVGA